MTDFMDTALNYQAGIRIAADAKRWVITNGITQMRLCEMCAQPILEGHVGCSCDKSHNPANCDRPTYDQLGERLRNIAGDNADLAVRCRKMLQTLLDRNEGKGASMMITSLSPTDVAEIKEALDWRIY
mgnify:FL=1